MSTNDASRCLHDRWEAFGNGARCVSCHKRGGAGGGLSRGSPFAGAAIPVKPSPGPTAARPYEVHAVAIPNDGTPVALKVGV